jgi:hypothetical protein
MLRHIVIQKHVFGSGGLGDFIRAALSYYSLCKRFNFEYYINFDENINLKKCFEIKETPDSYKKLNHTDLVIMNKLLDFKNIKEIEKLFINKIKNNPNTVFYLVSNALGMESPQNINLIKDYFFKNILKPSEAIDNYIKEIYNKYNLRENEYLSVHVRCGDLHLDPDTSPLGSDVRVDLYDPNIYRKFNSAIQGFKNDYNVNIPIVIHSDSLIFKNNLKKINNEYITIDNTVIHIADNRGVPKNENEYIQTIGEFFILAKSSFIFSPYTYSGFSHIGSLIYDKKLYTKINHGYLQMIHNNNIIFLK